MANPEHLEILKQGVEQWNEWRKEHPEVRPDLSKAEFAGRNLSGANFSGTDLAGTNFLQANLSKSKLRRARLRGVNLRSANCNHADLSGADLERADLEGGNLRGADLSEADVSWASLRTADLREARLERTTFSAARLSGANFGGANLTGADLGGADLSRTNLSGADLGGALASYTRFTAVDLSGVKRLETLKHVGPSSIGIDTIYKSHGKIPEVFLRGCGVPDEFIAYIGSLVGRPIEFYSCFISYSTKDQEFAERLHADLQAKGVRCWFAPEEMKAGRKLHEQIDEAIRLHDKLLLILSEHSMSSKWVKTEIANARAREEQEHKQPLFPITLTPFEEVKKWKLFDAETGDDSARAIREYFIPDFSNWKDHDSYQTAFQRLVKDLKASSAAG
jgi:uncharacterized protein YjbI with pentapeptide repeats